MQKMEENLEYVKNEDTKADGYCRETTILSLNSMEIFGMKPIMI